MPEFRTPNYNAFDPIWSCFIVVRLCEYQSARGVTLTLVSAWWSPKTEGASGLYGRF